MSDEFNLLSAKQARAIVDRKTDEIVAPVWHEIVHATKIAIMNAASECQFQTKISQKDMRGVDAQTVYRKLKPTFDDLGYHVLFNVLDNCIYINWEEVY